MKFFYPILILIALIPFVSTAQTEPSIVKGRITDQSGAKLPGVTIFSKRANRSVVSDDKGNYTIKLHPGKQELLVTAVGFEKRSFEISLEPGQTLTHDVKLKESLSDLDMVEVKGKTAIQEIKESPFNVVALDAKSQYNSTLDLGHMLAKASGVKIRETGGVGGDLNVNINGFTGRNIKIFMDGVPMQGNSSSFQLNNIPVSLAERIEVYKGVVPVEFGGDAIGGAINIVTNRTTNSFLDASYSYGSFNTHRSNIIIGHTTPKGFSFSLNAYQTYSDNDYKIKSRVITNGQYSRDTTWHKRFHSAYHNETVVAKVGWVNKSWADRFFLGATLSQDHQEIQNAPAVIEFVYGDAQKNSKGFQPNLEYYKRNLFFKGLTVRASANYNFNRNHNIDTSSYKYNWLGERTMAVSKGEIGTAALSDFDNKNYSAMANLTYDLTKAHAFTLNDTQTGSVRNITSTASEEVLTEFEKLRRLSLKNILGLSYRFRPNKQWNLNLFGKNYYQRVVGPVNAGDESHPSYVDQTATYNTQGYGLATTYFWRSFQFKGSVERAYRLPSDNELFGDEISEVGDAGLKAENSMNYNLGFTLNKSFADSNALYLDVNGYYRNIKDFIKREILPRTGTLTSANFGNVHNLGVDVEARYYIKNYAMIGGTFTTMNLYDNERYRDGQGQVESSTYKNRMPNVPYQFGSFDAAYYIHGLGKQGAKNVLNLEYNLNYVQEFFLAFEGRGTSKKYTLPTQLSHDFSATYMIKGGKYNFSLEAKNITNEELSDNFAMLKPGRAFYAKVRVYLMKRHGQNGQSK